MIRSITDDDQRHLELVAGFDSQIKAFVRRLAPGDDEAMAQWRFASQFETLSFDRWVNDRRIAIIMALDHRLGVRRVGDNVVRSLGCPQIPTLQWSDEHF